MSEDVGTTRRGRLTTRDRIAIWERERGRCMLCETKLHVGGFIFEHVRALELGGEDHPDNIRLTCKPCATEKTRDDHSRAAQAKRQKARAIGLRAPSDTPMPCGKNSPWKKLMNGKVVRRG